MKIIDNLIKRRFVRSLFEEDIRKIKFSSLDETAEFLRERLLNETHPNKMSCYMYLMTLLGDDFKREKYIEKQNNWLTDEKGELIIIKDLIDVVSKYLYKE